MLHTGETSLSIILLLFVGRALENFIDFFCDFLMKSLEKMEVANMNKYIVLWVVKLTLGCFAEAVGSLGRQGSNRETFENLTSVRVFFIFS